MKKNNKKNAVKATELLSEERAILNGEYGLASETYYHENGEVTISVMGSDSKDNATYEIKAVDDTHISMTTPSSGSGAMALPSITVNNIPVSVSNSSGAEVVSASISEVSGTITVNGAEKAYTFSDVVIVNTGKKISIAYSLQYGKMPMAIVTSFTGEK